MQTAGWLLERFIQIPLLFLLVSALGVETVIYVGLIGSWSFAISYVLFPVLLGAFGAATPFPLQEVNEKGHAESDQRLM